MLIIELSVMKYENIVVGALETNCYLAFCENSRKCAVIDPGADPEKIFRIIDDNDLKPVVLLNTHGHIDHIGANKAIKEKFGIPLYIHKADEKMLKSALQSGLALLLGSKASPAPDKFFNEGDIIDIGESKLEVIHTPGHSPGSVSFLTDTVLFSGDTLFCGGVGRTDLPGGSWDKLVNSIRKKILTLPDETLVLPGHGPATTVGQEKESNPYIK